MLLLIYLTCVAVVFYLLINKVKLGRCTRIKAIALHAAFTILPLVLYGAVFILLIGIEEITDMAIIGEGYARTLPLVIVGGVAIALLATLIFTLVVLARKSWETGKNKENRSDH